MLRKSNRKTETDFKNDIPEYNDEEILGILKKRKYYQRDAVELATEEALKRELIQSEQDLFDEEFRAEPLQFGIFPTIDDEKNKSKIRKSIARGILIAGVIPTIWGFLQFNSGQFLEGGILVLLGVVWIFLSASLIRQANMKMVYGLIVLIVFSVLYIFMVLSQRRTFIFMDFFIVAALYGFLIYGLLFIRHLK